MATFALAIALCLTVGVMTTPADIVYAGTTSGGSSMSDIESSLGLSNDMATNNVLGNVLGIISTLARVVGILLAAFGLYKLIVALKDQDANGITQGIVLIAVGVVLTFFKSILTSVFNVQIE